MASKLLICSASPLVVPNKANSGPLAAGFGPPSVVTLPSSSRAHSLVAKAQDQAVSEFSFGAKAGSEFSFGAKAGSEFLCDTTLPPLSQGEFWHNRIALVECPRYVRSPVRLTERLHEVEIWFDMAGYLAENTKVEITAGNTLLVYGRENDRSDFVRLLTYHLPPYCYCDRSKAKGELELGVLTIKIPKTTVNGSPAFIPITAECRPSTNIQLISTSESTVDGSPPALATNIAPN